MFDLKWIREHPDDFDRALRTRGLQPQAQGILAKDELRRNHIAALQVNQERRNVASKDIGTAKAEGDDVAAQSLIDEIAALKSILQEGADEERRLTSELNDLLASLPNRPLEDVPIGADESANEVVRTHGERQTFSFEPKQHFDIGEALGMMDFEEAARLSGARFVVLKDTLAKMERALAAFMLDLHTLEFGYQEIAPPLLVRDEVMFGTAQLPKFADDQFRTEDGFWLIPTAEVPLTNLVRGQVLEEADLPLRRTAFTPCFRLEAGAAGKDTRGMIRQHQFSKVELVSIAHPDHSRAEHERMTACAEEVLKRLGLAYQTIVLSTGDMGFAARKTYDIEVWLPGQNTYREISSCSICGDFQARRMNARFRPSGSKELEFVHTLNGSGLAVGRTLIAILENYQQEDGSVRVPEVLRAYFGGLEKIERC